jgi:hypothetical protein
MREIKIDPEGLEGLERRNPDLRQILAQKQASLQAEEALQSLASAYKEGLEAGGEEEARRRVDEMFDKINPPKE